MVENNVHGGVNEDVGNQVEPTTNQTLQPKACPSNVQNHVSHNETEVNVFPTVVGNKMGPATSMTFQTKNIPPEARSHMPHNETGFTAALVTASNGGSNMASPGGCNFASNGSCNTASKNFFKKAALSLIFDKDPYSENLSNVDGHIVVPKLVHSNSPLPTETRTSLFVDNSRQFGYALKAGGDTRAPSRADDLRKFGITSSSFFFMGLTEPPKSGAQVKV